MRVRRRVVIDTNVLLSGLLFPASVPGQAVRKAVREGTLLVPEATLGELESVLFRQKFNPYLTVEERREFFEALGQTAQYVQVIYRVHVCRDPKDDKFVELAVNGRADFIVTGDKDLLCLSSFQSVLVITPGAYLELE